MTHVEELLLPHLRGELAAPERERVEAHLARCEECRRARAAYERLAADLARAPLSVPEPHWGAYRAELRDKLERRTARRGRTWRWAPVPVTLAAGLAAILVYVGLPGQGERAADDGAAVGQAVLAGRLDLIQRLDMVQHLDMLEDFEVISRLDNGARADG